MRNVAPPVQFIAVAVRSVNTTDKPRHTHTPSHIKKQHTHTHTHRTSHIIDRIAPPPPPKTDRPSHRAIGGGKNSGHSRTIVVLKYTNPFFSLRDNVYIGIHKP